MIGIWMLLIIGFLVLLAVPFSSYFLQRKQYKQEDWVYFSKKGKRDSSLYAFYSFFSDWKVTKHHVYKLKSHFDKYYPGKDKESACKTMQIWFFEMGLGIVAVMCILFFKLGILSSIITLSLVYFINTGHVHKKNERLDRFFLEDLKIVLSKVRHTYQSSDSIKTALELSLDENTPESMKVHLKYLISVLEEEDMEESIQQYMDNVPNDYMKEFMALCATIEQFGDPKVNKGISQFLTRLLSLKTRIENDLRNRKKKQHLFYGFTVIIALPLYLMPVIRSWAIHSLPMLEKYYSGSYGIWSSLITFVLILLFFKMNIRLQENFHLMEKSHVILFRICEIGNIHEWLCTILEKNEGKRRRMEQLLTSTGETITTEQFLLKRILFAIGVFVVANFVFLGIHSNQRNYYIYNTQELGHISSIISQEEERVLQKSVGKLLKQYAGKTVTTELTETIRKKIAVDNSEYIVEEVLEEVTLRLNQYNKEYYRWYEYLVCILLSMIGYYYPLWSVLYERKVVNSHKLTEIMQLQSILSILVPIAQMTPEIMLLWMDKFAVIFRTTIRQAIERFSSEEQMEELIDTITFEPMKRIIENLIASDSCGITQAFDELEEEHAIFEEEKKQENELQLDDKSALGKYIAILPFGFMLFVYFIIPFTIETMKILMNQI